jgi:alpha-glucosidase
LISQAGSDWITSFDAGWCDISDFSKILGWTSAKLGVRRRKEVVSTLDICLTLKHNMAFLQQFHAWGIKGIMVDFMDREDQLIVRFLERVAEETARNKLMVLFHGACKPVGLRKVYPNLINREGVAGHEFNKWTDRITPEHDLIIPFTRMIAGPLDYEGGGMINAQKNSFRIVDDVPMTQGTRIPSWPCMWYMKARCSSLGGISAITSGSRIMRLSMEKYPVYGMKPWCWMEKYPIISW